MIAKFESNCSECVHKDVCAFKDKFENKKSRQMIL